MTALESSTFKWGGTTYPLATVASGATGTLVQRVDPAVYYMADYLTTMLATYAGAAWAEQATAVGGQFTGKSIVAYTMTRDPAPDLTDEQIKFPLLAVYRVSAKDFDHTLTWERSDEVWRVDYVLPPMSAAERERILPFLDAAHDITTKKVTDLQDASYRSGARIGDTGVTGIMEAGVIDAKFSAWDNGKQLFPAVQMTLSVKQRRGIPSDAFDDMDGVDLAVDVDTPTTAPLADVADEAIDS